MSVAWVGDTPTRKDIPVGIQCWINVKEVDPEVFDFEEGDIYTDGSLPATDGMNLRRAVRQPFRSPRMKPG